MKTTFINIATASVLMSTLLLSCKKEKPSTHFGNCIPQSECNLHGTGTIERCMNDSNLWFINAQLNGNSPVLLTKVLVPVNLPGNYKVNYKTVKFDFKYLNDSVIYSCGCFDVPPFPKASKIKLCNITVDSNVFIVMKPVIYLYPQKTSNINVKLEYKGNLTVTYPDYDANISGWNVIAKPDGTITNKADNMEYQYLFWEGTPNKPYNFNMTEGFCIKGSDTRAFLQKTLPKLGLTPKEYNDMIVFWLPKMMNNEFNLIHFADDEYLNSAPLAITPKPNNVIRVFMAYQPTKTFIQTKEPVFTEYSRKGFTVVEWGGMELPEYKNQQVVSK